MGDWCTAWSDEADWVIDIISDWWMSWLANGRVNGCEMSKVAMDAV